MSSLEHSWGAGSGGICLHWQDWNSYWEPNGISAVLYQWCRLLTSSYHSSWRLLRKAGNIFYSSFNIKTVWQAWEAVTSLNYTWQGKVRKKGEVLAEYWCSWVEEDCRENIVNKNGSCFEHIKGTVYFGPLEECVSDGVNSIVSH